MATDADRLNAAAQQAINRRDTLWREYEHSRQGIADYDGYLFRVRNWNITITALFLAAVLGTKSVIDSPLEFGVAAFLIGGISTCFWMQDAANKSLQYVHIRNSARLEKELSGKCADPDGHGIRPSISHRFEARDNSEFERIVRRMWDPAVQIYYVPTMLISYIVIGAAAALSILRANSDRVSLEIGGDGSALAIGLGSAGAHVTYPAIAAFALAVLPVLFVIFTRIKNAQTSNRNEDELFVEHVEKHGHCVLCERADGSADQA